jgi:hypothetical protein
VEENGLVWAVEGTCDHGNDPWGCIKFGVLEGLRTTQNLVQRHKARNVVEPLITNSINQSLKERL